MDFFRKKFIERQYNLTPEDIAKMSTEEIKRRFDKLSPELSEDIKKFSQYGVNDSQYVYDVYKTRASLAFSNELLKRNSKNAKDVRNFKINSCIISLALVLSMLCTMGYLNRGEKQKVVVSQSGKATFSNGMTYSGFSSSDLEYNFGYTGEEDTDGLVINFLQDCFMGLGNLITSNHQEKISFEKALRDAEMILKFSGVLSLDGVRSTNFYIDNVSVDDMSKLDLCINSDVQSLCRIYTLGNIFEGYGEEFSNLFYSNVYYMNGNEKIFLNSKEELIRLVGFSTVEEYDNFVLDVINTLNGNVFYYSNPKAGDFYVELDKGMVLNKTI